MNRLCLLFLVMLAGCFKWTEGFQGNSRSIGSGMPLWSAKTPANAQNSSAAAAPGASTQPLTPCRPVDIDSNGNGVWLNELNRWREMARLREPPRCIIAVRSMCNISLSIGNSFRPIRIRTRQYQTNIFCIVSKTYWEP